MSPKPQYLQTHEVFERIKNALNKKLPFSLVRIGDGENQVLAQDSVWSIEDVLKERWAIKANKGEKGVTLPNLVLRDQVVRAIKKADVVGILDPNDTKILAPARLKRALTDQIFTFYRINPPFTCDALLFRINLREPEFWQLLKGRKILLITRNIEGIGSLLRNKPFELHITASIYFNHHDQMKETLKKIAANKDNFDIALISSGVNAVVLAQKVAELTGKVGIDVGKALSPTHFN